MSKEIELLKECRSMLDNPFNGTAGLILRNRIDDYFDQPEVPEDVYQKLLSVEAGNEVAVLPSELWLDGYETGRKHHQKPEPLSDGEITDLWANKSPANEFECVRLVEKAHGITGGVE